MFKKPAAALLVLTLLFTISSAAGASGPPGFAAPGGNLPNEVEQVSDSLIASATGASRAAACAGLIIGASLAFLAVGAATGGVGWALTGAFLPNAVVICI